TAEF
ncbi:phage antirepressor KilAC domain protein, partial [Escherichia coli 95.0183]